MSAGLTLRARCRDEPTTAPTYTSRDCATRCWWQARSRGRVRAIDTHTAETTPGVVAVLSHLNLPNFARQPIWDIVRVTGMSFAPMQNDAVHYAGQPVAMVVADTVERAQEGARLLDVDYEPAEPVGTLSDAEARGGVFDVDHVMGVLPAHYHRGDVESAFASAPHLLDQTYSLSARSDTTRSSSPPPLRHGTAAG